MEDTMEPHSGLFCKDQTFATRRLARKQAIFMCVLLTQFDQLTPLCTYKKTTCLQKGLDARSASVLASLITALPVSTTLASMQLPSHPKSHYISMSVFLCVRDEIICSYVSFLSFFFAKMSQCVIS